MRSSTLTADRGPVRDLASSRPGSGLRPEGQEARKAERLHFLRAFLRKPITVGAPCPSSRALAQAMLQDCDLRNAETVVELGPGTGAFTRLILQRIGRRTLFLALELDASCVKRLRENPGGFAVYQDSAEHLARYLARHGRVQADCIISGLPWSNMRAQLQDRILDAVVEALAPRGVFTTFAYIHAAWLPTAVRFRKRLKQRFDSVKTSRIVWGNLPPAYVYRCRRRAPSTASGRRVLGPKRR
jgi:phosphatidylethanolamine/phosphatidyl-N-methylethanolamine N-methyltransferase